MIGPACSRCGRIHAAADVRAMGRFAGTTHYETPDGRVFLTREAAESALCESRADTT